MFFYFDCRDVAVSRIIDAITKKISVMMQGELFKRYIWLIELIFRNDGITRDEINRQWRLSHLNNDKEKELPERTFHCHRKAIEEKFDIAIICDRHGEKSYHIANKEDLKEGGAKNGC